MTGKKVRIARKRANITQTALANALGVGRSTVCNWENGYSEPAVSTLRRVSRILGVRLTELVA